jgi:hypothetical protein
LALLGFFRRRPRIGSAEQLADFIDEQSAFLVQKGIYEYSRARAGPFSKMLLVEPAFLALVEESRWRAYPLGLAMVAEMVEGLLRAHGGADRREILDPLSEIVLSVFDRYPTPEALSAAEWAEARAALSRRLQLIGLHPRKLVKDVPEPFAQAYFDLMPIHEKLRALDFDSIRNYLRISLINIHDELDGRMDAGEMARLIARPVADE